MSFMVWTDGEHRKYSTTTDPDVNGTIHDDANSVHATDVTNNPKSAAESTNTCPSEK
jgi:hypothetical protein